MPQVKVYIARVYAAIKEDGSQLPVDHQWFVIENFDTIDGPRTRVSVHVKDLDQAYDHVRKAIPNV